MLITPHATLGAAIAVQVGGPIALPLAVASHFALDMIPHWQAVLFPYKPTPKAWVVLVIDLFFSLVFVHYIAQIHPGQSLFIWTCAALAVAPDLDSIVSLTPKPLKNIYFKRFYQWHVRIQRETPKLSGLIPQVIVVILSIFISV